MLAAESRNALVCQLQLLVRVKHNQFRTIFFIDSLLFQLCFIQIQKMCEWENKYGTYSRFQTVWLLSSK